jgi:capsular polysaccharide biosynthesis protein
VIQLPSRLNMSSANSRPEEHVDAIDYARRLWRRRVVVLIAALACAGLAAIWSRMQPQRYEATVRLSATSPEGENPVGTATGFLQSQVAIASVIDEFGLSRSPEGYDVMRFAHEALSVSPIPNTSLLQLAVRLDDPHLAARVANRLTDQARELATAAIDVETERIRDILTQSLQQAAERLRTAQAAYESYHSEAQIVALRGDVKDIVDTHIQLRDVVTEIDGVRVHIARLEEQIAARVRVRLPSASAPGHGRSESIGGGVRPKLIGTADAVDDVKTLDADLLRARARLSSLEKRRNQMTSDARLDKESSRRLKELFRRESRLEALEASRDQARRTHNGAAASLDGAALIAQRRSVTVEPLGRAEPPLAPMPSRTLRYLLLGLSFGLVAASFIVLASDLLKPQVSRAPLASAAPSRVV